jgi:hypothetical protein
MNLAHKIARAPPSAIELVKIELYCEPVGLLTFLSFTLSKMEKASCNEAA